MSASAYVTLNAQQSQAIENTKAKAQLLTQTVTNIIRMDMEGHYEKDLEKLVRVVGQFRDIETIRIFNIDGTILHSADPTEIFNGIDDLVMNVYQSGDLSKPFRSEEKGHLSFCRVEVIYNEDTCHRCHGSDDEIIGVLEVCLSMATADQQLRDNSRFMILSTVMTMVLVALAISILTTLMVKQPIASLERTMHSAQEGNLEVRAETQTRDEVGRLGRSFNRMIEHLEDSKDEIDRLHSEQMRKAERLASIGEMAASVAHEIKNPLAGLAGATHVLAKSFTDEDPRLHAAEEMLKLTDRLDKTINDLLGFAKVTTPKFSQLNPNDVIEETLFFVRKEIGDSSGEIVEHLDATLPVIPMDGALIQQVLFNLIINGRHASGADGRVVIASASEPDRMPTGYRTEDFIEISISDNGPGIDPEVFADIYKPFFTTKTKGTGLGLSICRNILEAHSGIMDFNTIQGEGTTFYVWLKRERPDE
jgi:signal transduction histidine kinase